MSAEGIAQIACVMGSCTAGGAYVPAMSDETVIVRDQGTIFLAGPPLVKAATGEVITAEELGGADTHGRKSGVVDHVAENDEHALTIVRDIVANSAADARRARRRRCDEPRAAELSTPRSSTASSPTTSARPTTCARSSPASSTAASSTSSRRSTARTLVCGFARIWGIRSRSSPTTACCSRESALKGAHFIELACQRRIPLLFLQNISGFMVGGKYEAEGIAKDGAKLVTAVATARCRSSPC